MSKMKLGIFLIYTTIGSFVWNIVLVYLGVTAGVSWEKIVAGSDEYTKVTMIALGIISIIAIYLIVKKTTKKQVKV